MTDQIPEQKVLIIGASDEPYRGILDIVPNDKVWEDKQVPFGESSSLAIQDMDIASLYGHLTPRVIPVRCYGESEIRDATLASYGISYTRAAKKARKAMSAQEQFINIVMDLLTVMENTPVRDRRSVHKAEIAEAKRELRNNPLYRPASFGRTIDYELENGEHGGVFIPIGLAVDGRVTNQQRTVARLSKEQFGKRWRHGLINIFEAGL